MQGQRMIIHTDDKLGPQKLVGHTHQIQTIDICETRSLLVSGGYDQTLRIWSLQDNSLLKTYQDMWVYQVVISKEGDKLAYAGGIFGKIKLMDISRLNNHNTVSELNGHQDSIIRIKFSNDAQYLISCSEDRTVKVWNVEIRQELFKYYLGRGVYGVAISIDNNFLASGSCEGDIKIWNFKKQKLICTKKGHVGKTQIQFSSNQQIFVSNGDNNIKMWSLKQMNNGKLQLIKKFQVPVNKLIFALLTTDIRFIITYDLYDSSLRVIDSNNGGVLIQSKFRKFYPGQNRVVGISEKMNILVLLEGRDIIIQKLQ